MYSLLLLFLFISQNDCQVDKVYRFDLKHPRHVFYRGFTAHGSSEDPFKHILGESCRDKTSSFISTTENKQWAENQLTNILYKMGRSVEKEVSGFLYEMRPNEKFYSAEKTLMKIAEAGVVEISDFVRAMVSNQQEYMAHNEISPSLIYSVQEYMYNHFHSGGGRVQLVGKYINPIYLHAETVASNEPFLYNYYRIPQSTVASIWNGMSMCFQNLVGGILCEVFVDN